MDGDIPTANLKVLKSEAIATVAPASKANGLPITSANNNAITVCFAVPVFVATGAVSVS